MKLTFHDLNNRYEEMTMAVRCHCTLATELVGGQPSDDDGLRAYVIHQLGLTDEKEITEAIERIRLEELGVEVTPPEGEIPEKRTYGVRSLRRTEHGVWLGDWMVKACLKQAASRLGIFVEVKGSKGDFAEAGRVRAVGESLLEPNHPERIYLDLSAPTYFKDFMGRVQTPQGPTSIIHSSECIPPGSKFAFEYRLIQGKLKAEDLRDVIALSMVCGLGSARSLERGRFIIDDAEIVDPAQPRKRERLRSKNSKPEAELVAA